MKKLVMLTIFMSISAISQEKIIQTPERKKAMFIKRCLAGTKDGDDDRSHSIFLEKMQNCQTKYDSLLRAEDYVKNNRKK